MTHDRLEQIRREHSTAWTVVRSHRHAGELLAEVDRLRAAIRTHANDLRHSVYAPTEGWRDYSEARCRAIAAGEP